MVEISAKLSTAMWQVLKSRSLQLLYTYIHIYVLYICMYLCMHLCMYVWIYLIPRCCWILSDEHKTMQREMNGGCCCCCCCFKASPNHDFEGYVAHNYQRLQNTYSRHVSPTNPYRIICWDLVDAAAPSSAINHFHLLVNSGPGPNLLQQIMLKFKWNLAKNKLSSSLLLL